MAAPWTSESSGVPLPRVERRGATAVRSRRPGCDLETDPVNRDGGWRLASSVCLAPSPIDGDSHRAPRLQDSCRSPEPPRRLSPERWGRKRERCAGCRPKLSGTPAHLLTWSCRDGYSAMGITALRANLGYFMIVASRTTGSRTSDRTAFSGARASFRFVSN